MDNLTAAFHDLARQGFLARERHWCCSSCAGCQLSTDAEVLKDKGIEIKGVVFYHEQDAERRDKNKDFYIRYGNVDTSKYDEIGLPSKEVGEIVVETLKKYRVTTEWNGDPDSCILVKVRSIQPHFESDPPEFYMKGGGKSSC